MSRHRLILTLPPDSGGSERSASHCCLRALTPAQSVSIRRRGVWWPNCGHALIFVFRPNVANHATLRYINSPHNPRSLFPNTLESLLQNSYSAKSCEYLYSRLSKWATWKTESKIRTMQQKLPDEVRGYSCRCARQLWLPQHLLSLQSSSSTIFRRLHLLTPTLRLKLTFLDPPALRVAIQVVAGIAVGQVQLSRRSILPRIFPFLR